MVNVKCNKVVDPAFYTDHDDILGMWVAISLSYFPDSPLVFSDNIP